MKSSCLKIHPRDRRQMLWIIFILLECLCVTYYTRSLLNLQNQQNTSNLSKQNSRSNIYHQAFRNKVIDTAHPNMVRSKAQVLYPDLISSFRRYTDESQEFDKRHFAQVPERGYPKRTHLLDYETSATEQEIEKHDRLLVQGMYYMKTTLFQDFWLDQGSKKSAAARTTTFTAATTTTFTDTSMITSNNPSLCINIYLCNRRIPYINSLLMSLTSFTTHQNKMDMRKAQIRLINTENRPERLDFKYMTQLLSKLPFVHSVHNITYYDEIYQDVIQHRELDFRETFISDQLSGLNICIESGLPFCLMMEEDSIVPVDFMSKLWQYILTPLEEQGIIQMDGTGQISVLSLYAYYNLAVKGSQRLYYPEYAKEMYREDYARINSERFSQGMPPYAPMYHVRDKDYMYGTVAMLYTRESAIKLVQYLRHVGVNPIHNADEFINCDLYFPKEMGVPRKHVQPSLVNHIGYYSERMGQIPERGMFSQLNTDARFMYDAGVL